MYYWGYTPIHCIESCQMFGQCGLKVPPPLNIESCGSETPELVYFALYNFSMEHPSYCIIELMYHCIALFHPELSYSHCIIINMYSARTNWHKSAVRHMARMHSGTTQYGLKYHCIALHRNPVWRLVKVHEWCPHSLTHLDVIINHIVSVLPWSETLSSMAVELRPNIGYVKQVYFGWVWSGRGIIPAKSVGISIKLVSQCKVIGINASHLSDEPQNWFRSAMSQLSCKTRCW